MHFVQKKNVKITGNNFLGCHLIYVVGRNGFVGSQNDLVKNENISLSYDILQSYDFHL